MAGARVDVEIVRFAGTRDASIAELVIVLGIERAEAVSIVERGGGMIKRAIPRQVAETYRDGLARAGVVVELRDAVGPPRRSDRPKSPTARPPGTGTTDVVRGAPASVPPAARSFAAESDRPPAPSSRFDVPPAAALPSVDVTIDEPAETAEAPSAVLRSDTPATAARSAPPAAPRSSPPAAPPSSRPAPPAAPSASVAVAASPPPRSAPAVGSFPPPRSSPPPTSSVPPLAGTPFHVVSERRPVSGAHVIEPSSPATEGTGLPSFWGGIVPALAYPLRGPGIKWMAWIAVYAIFLELVATVARWAGPLGIVIVIFYGGGLAALATGYFRACMWGRSVNAASPNDMPEMDAETLKNELLLPGLWTASFIALSQAALWGWLVFEVRRGTAIDTLATSWITWALALAPVLYWPMGIGRIALTGSFAAIWNVPAGLRAIFAAPLEYAALVAIALAAYLVPWVVFFLWLVPLGPVAMLIGAPFFFGVPLAYSHGVQGTLMAYVFAKAAPALEE